MHGRYPSILTKVTWVVGHMLSSTMTVKHYVGDYN
jgi:hypothetical protein